MIVCWSIVKVVMIAFWDMLVPSKESIQVDKVPTLSPTKTTFDLYDWLLLDMLCCDWLLQTRGINPCLSLPTCILSLVPSIQASNIVENPNCTWKTASTISWIRVPCPWDTWASLTWHLTISAGKWWQTSDLMIRWMKMFFQGLCLCKESSNVDKQSQGFILLFCYTVFCRVLNQLQ